MTTVLQLSTAPIREPVTLDEVKLHLRLDDGDDYTTLASLQEESLLNTYILAARTYIESQCGPLITQTWVQYDDDWPDGDILELWKPRVQSVTSIIYTEEDGTATTFSSSYYDADTADSLRSRIILKPDYQWPTDALYSKNPIATTFVCGYGDDAEDVPEPVRLALMFMVAHWYEERQPVVVNEFRSVSLQEIPLTVDALLANYRFWLHT